MSNFDHLPDDATRLSAANLHSHFTRHSHGHTLIGWIGRYAVLLMLFGGGAVIGSLLFPVLYALAQ